MKKKKRGREKGTVFKDQGTRESDNACLQRNHGGLLIFFDYSTTAIIGTRMSLSISEHAPLELSARISSRAAAGAV